MKHNQDLNDFYTERMKNETKLFFSEIKVEINRKWNRTTFSTSLKKKTSRKLNKPHFKRKWSQNTE